MKQKVNIFITLALALLCAGLLAVWMFLRQKGDSQNLAEIIYQGELIRTVDLSTITTTETFTVGEDGAQNTIQISPGRNRCHSGRLQRSDLCPSGHPLPRPGTDRLSSSQIKHPF